MIEMHIDIHQYIIVNNNYIPFYGVYKKTSSRKMYEILKGIGNDASILIIGFAKSNIITLLDATKLSRCRVEYPSIKLLQHLYKINKCFIKKFIINSKWLLAKNNPWIVSVIFSDNQE